MKLREAQASKRLGFFIGEKMKKSVTLERASFLKDYLFIALLVGFLVYKFPGNNSLTNAEPFNLKLIPYMEKIALLDNSISQSGVRLLDIKLELESSLIPASGNLIARTRFDSFGNVPTLINLRYVVTDLQGRELYSEVEEIMVETERTITKTFPKLNLKKGKYYLTLTTLYNFDVKDEFRQGFEVEGLSKVEIISWGVLIIGIIVATGSIIYNYRRTKSN